MVRFALVLRRTTGLQDPRDGYDSPYKNRILPEYVVDRIIDAAMDEGGHVLYRTRWMGYGEGEDTWQEEDTLPNHFIRRYWKTKGLTPLQGKHTLH